MVYKIIVRKPPYVCYGPYYGSYLRFLQIHYLAISTDLSLLTGSTVWPGWYDCNDFNINEDS